MNVTLYHNPRCSKSRETLALLEARGIQPTIIEYLKTPPSRAELETLLRRLGIGARALVRDKEAVWAELGLAEERDEARILDALLAHPVLIERPIVVCGERAVIGRPPGKVEQILP